MNHDIFISYSSKDEKVVSKYANILQTYGYDVWIDHEGLSHGHEFPNQIADAIQGCKLLLFFSSKNSNQSKWVIREVVYADKQDKTIIPIKLDTCDYNKSLQLLLSGIEHLEASIGSQENVMNMLLKVIMKEIGQRGEKDLCPVISKSCPIEKPRIIDNDAFEKISEANRRLAFRNRIKNEAFIFTALCELIWLLLLGVPLILLGVLSSSLSLYICTILAFFLAIYTTHISTNSLYVPGWYNRHLTTYGALIIALDFFVSTTCISVSLAFCGVLYTSLLLFLSSIIGIVGIACIFRLKMVGYFVLWLDTLLFTASTYCIWTNEIRFWGMISLLLILSMAMAILTYTLKLRYNGSSTWGLLFGKEKNKKDSAPSKIEQFLLIIWSKIYK